MKKIQNSNQKLKLSRETLRQLQARQLERAAGGTGITCITNCPPCYPSLELSICTGD
ncbi:MAG TPA: class I lanthipeptide [Haliangium sp.]|nr:class I lanthipeptide [Haliangium sp.]